MENKSGAKQCAVKYSDEVTLYLRIDEYDILREGVVFSSEPNVFYCFKKGYSKPENAGMSIVNLSDFVFEKLAKTAKEEMDEYLKEHIYDYSIYEGDYSIWSYINRLEAQQPNLGRDYEANYDSIYQGLMLIKSPFTDRYVYQYDLIGHSDMLLRHPKDEDRCMDMVYDSGQKMIQIALKQLEMGCAPRALVEVLRVKWFLEDKKSVSIRLKDGTKIKLKAMADGSCLSLGELIAILPTRVGMPQFKLKDSYYTTPRLKHELPLSEVDCLEYGKQVFFIKDAELNGPDAMSPLASSGLKLA